MKEIPPHAIDPHFQIGGIVNADDTKLLHGSGDWVCYKCKKPLKGTYLRPVIPWEYKTLREMPRDGTQVAGLETTE